MRLNLLGTQGWIPTGRRETTCLAVEDGDRLLIFDAGTGLRRLLEPPGSSLLAAARELHLFLTHYHLDHVCGLAYVPGIFAGRRLTVHVPEAAVTDVDPERGIAEAIRSPYNPRPWSEITGMELTTEVLRAGVNHVAGHELRVRRQRHPNATAGYRLDDAFVFCTDTVADEATAEFAAGAGLLLHEAWIDGVEENEPEKAGLVATAYAAHTSARQAAGIAARAGVGDLILTHLNPFFDEGYYRQMAAAARTIFPRSHVQPDLYVHPLDRA
jgi:ribonuclease BN (tRNA processing enzyme)